MPKPVQCACPMLGITRVNRRMFIAPLATLLMTASLAGAQPQTTNNLVEKGFPLTAGDAVQVVASGNSIATVTESAMGVTVLSVWNAQTGEEVVRREGIERSRITFNGRYVGFRADKNIRVLDVENREEWAPWPASNREVLDTLCSGRRMLHAVARDQDALLLLGATLDEPRSTIAITLPDMWDRSERIDVLCSDSNVLVVARDSGTALLRRSANAVEVYELNGRTPIAVTDDFVYALNGPSTLTRRPIVGAAPWEELYTTTARLGPRTIPSATAAAIATVQVEAEATDLVSISTLDRTAVLRRLPPGRSWDQPSLWSLTDDRLVSVGRRDGRVWIFSMALSVDPPSTTPAAGTTTVASQTAAGSLSLAWLDRQLGPLFRTRFNTEGRLIDSYEDDKRVGWTYDAAVAAVAFTAWGKTEPARQLLAGLEHLQNEDGSWDFAYDPDQAVPHREKQYIGAMAWVVMAANFFEWDTGDRSFDRMAHAALRFIAGFLVRDPASPLNGGVSMGPSAPGIFSTEHNTDAMSAFHWRGRLANRPEQIEIASQLRAFLFRELGAGGADASAFHFKVGANDASLYLDAQTWTTLALAGSDRSDPRLRRALSTAEAKLRVDRGRIGPVTNLIGFRDAESAAEKVWSEGTEGMVAARLLLGDNDLARQYHEQTARMQTASGGIPYASENADGWSTQASVAGTAWFLLNEATPPRNPFTPEIVR